jgi:hypothetical protein
MADELASSGADLASSFTPSSSAADTGSTTSTTPAGDTGGGDALDIDLEEPPSPDAPGGEEALDYDALNDQGNPDEQAAAAAPETEEVPPVVEPAPDTELPEGVRKGKDRRGNDGYWLNPNRYEKFHSAHKLLRDGEALIGEPLTSEALAYRQQALMGQEKLYADLTSADPKAQANLIDHFFSEAQRAKDEGAVGADPMVPFTQAFYERLKTSPDAYSTLRSQAATDLIEEMYTEAAQTNNRALWLSVQHLSKNLGMQFRPEAEMATRATTQGVDPQSQLRAEVERLRAENSSHSAQSQAAQFENWRGGVNKNIYSALSTDVITPALASVAASYSKFPETFQSIQNMLHSKVMEGFKADPAFRDRVNTLLAQANRATTAAKRQEYAQQLVQLHANKARGIVEANKAPILREAAGRLKAQSDATHQRRKTAQEQRSPGGGVPARTSLAPVQGMDFEMGTPANLAKSLAGLFPGR